MSDIYRANDQVSESAGGIFCCGGLRVIRSAQSDETLKPLPWPGYTIDPSNGQILAPPGYPTPASGEQINYPLNFTNQKTQPEPQYMVFDIGGLEAEKYFESYPAYNINTDVTAIPQVYLLPSGGQCPPSSVAPSGSGITSGWYYDIVISFASGTCTEIDYASLGFVGGYYSDGPYATEELAVSANTALAVATETHMNNCGGTFNATTMYG